MIDNLYALMDLDVSSESFRIIEILQHNNHHTVWFSFDLMPDLEIGYKFHGPSMSSNGISYIRSRLDQSWKPRANGLFGSITKRVENRIQEHPKFRLLNLLGIQK
jgi:hypothetical protein